MAYQHRFRYLPTRILIKEM